MFLIETLKIRERGQEREISFPRWLLKDFRSMFDFLKAISWIQVRNMYIIYFRIMFIMGKIMIALILRLMLKF